MVGVNFTPPRMHSACELPPSRYLREVRKCDVLTTCQRFSWHSNQFGMDYAYAYLWRGEPRFKLRFGSYLAAPRWRRVVLHLSGTLGTPIATALCSAVATPSQPMLGRVLAWLAALHLLFQAAILVLAGAGVHRMPLLGILRLTSAGAAGFELRGALRSRAVR
jgi:hypothetical protein